MNNVNMDSQGSGGFLGKFDVCFVVFEIFQAKCGSRLGPVSDCPFFVENSSRLRAFFRLALLHLQCTRSISCFLKGDLLL